MVSDSVSYLVSLEFYLQVTGERNGVRLSKLFSFS